MAIPSIIVPGKQVSVVKPQLYVPGVSRTVRHLTMPRQQCYAVIDNNSYAPQAVFPLLPLAGSLLIALIGLTGPGQSSNQVNPTNGNQFTESGKTGGGQAANNPVFMSIDIMTSLVPSNPSGVYAFVGGCGTLTNGIALWVGEFPTIKVQSYDRLIGQGGGLPVFGTSIGQNRGNNNTAPDLAIVATLAYGACTFQAGNDWTLEQQITSPLGNISMMVMDKPMNNITDPLVWDGTLSTPLYIFSMVSTWNSTTPLFN